MHVTNQIGPSAGGWHQFVPGESEAILDPPYSSQHTWLALWLPLLLASLVGVKVKKDFEILWNSEILTLCLSLVPSPSVPLVLWFKSLKLCSGGRFLFFI